METEKNKITGDDLFIRMAQKVVMSNLHSTYRCDSEQDVHITITSEYDTKLIIYDDNAYHISRIFIKTDNKDIIDRLEIVVKSGSHHNEDVMIGNDLIDTDDSDDYLSFDKPRVTIKFTNTIRNIIIQQEMCTEHIYSYYGNQDGFNPGEIIVKYDTSFYKSIKAKGNISLEGSENITGLKVTVN